MEHFLQSVAFAMLAVLLCLLIGEQNRVFVPVLSIGVCCMILIGLIRYLEPVIALLRRMRELSGISTQMLGIVLKAVGISLIGQLGALICADAGQSALGKAIGLLSGGVIAWISLPLVEELMALLQEVLGRV